jgi:hypothetical protein
MIRENYPQYKCVIGCLPQYLDVFRASNPQLDLQSTGPHKVFIEYLKRAKVVVNIEMKARGGRIPMWGFYAGLPVITSSGAFTAQIYPDLSFDRIDLELIIEKALFAIENKDSIMEKANRLVEPFYFENWEADFYNKLGLK